MSGTNIRGLRHLVRLMPYNSPQNVLVGNGSRQMLGCLVKVKNRWNFDQILFYQNCNVDRSYSLNDYDATTRKIIEPMNREWGGCWIINGGRGFEQFGEEVILLPSNIKEEIEAYVKQNKKTVGQAVEKHLNMRSPILYAFYMLCPNQPQLLAWAIRNYAKDNMLYTPIKHILTWQNGYAQLVSKLSKGTIIAYNGREGVNALMSEIVSLRQDKRANDMINMFNTSQKKLLKEATLDKKHIKALGRLKTLSETKQKNLIRKVSTIEDIHEILKHVSFATSGQFEWNKESVLDFINNVEGLDCDIVLNTDNIILVSVKSYDTVKHLAKTTNWCISKNKSYWNNYMGNHNNTQYVLFNFNCKEDEECSIVGFTTNEMGMITHAHSFTNINMMEGEGSGPVELTSFISNSPSIFALLKKLHVPMHLFLKMEEKKYKWNKEDFIACLDKCIPVEDYSLLMVTDKTMVISTTHANVKYLMGEDVYCRVLEEIGSNAMPNEFMLFCDFENNKGPQTAIITTHATNFTQKCDDMFDELGLEMECGTFDALLREYGLPTNIIRRSQDKMSAFVNDFNNFRLANLGIALDDENVRKTLMEKKDEQLIRIMYENILESVRSHSSLDLIKLIYAKGLNLTDLLTPSYFSKLLYGMSYHYIHHAAHLRKQVLPTAEEIAKLHENTLRADHCVWVGMFVAIDLITTNETDAEYYTEEFGRLFRQGSHRAFFKYLSEKWLKIADMSVFNKGLSEVLGVAIDFNDKEIMEYLKAENLHVNYAMELMRRLPNDHPLYQVLLNKAHTARSTVEDPFFSFV